MKLLQLVLLTGGMLLLNAHCAKNTDTLGCGLGSLVCEVTDAEGTIVKMECFNRYTIQTRHPETDSIIYGIPDQLNDQFNEVGKKVVFSGVFRYNTLTPIFPDPDFSAETIFQLAISKIQ